MLNLSSYSDRFGLELFLRDKGLYTVIGDLTTNSIGDRHRASPIIGINGVFPRNSKELLSSTFRKALETKNNVLELTLFGGREIELLPLGTLQRIRNIFRFSPLLNELNKYPEGTPIDLTQLKVNRSWTQDENGGRLGFGKY